MNVLNNILIAIAVIIAIAFSLLVLITGKGDAMSGGGSVRTTFKGKASFDDIMSRWTLYIGAAFMVLVLIINVVTRRLDATPVIDRNVEVTQPANTGTNAPANAAPTNATPTNPVPTNEAPANTAPANAAGTPAPTGTNAAPTNVPGANGPLDSTPATVPGGSAAFENLPGNAPGTSSPGYQRPTEPSVVPTTPGTAGAGTTTGGTANAAPPVGNR